MADRCVYGLAGFLVRASSRLRETARKSDPLAQLARARTNDRVRSRPGPAEGTRVRSERNTCHPSRTVLATSVVRLYTANTRPNVGGRYTARAENVNSQ